MDLKLCSGCKIEKSTSEFSKKGDRLQAKCKPCVNAYNKVHYESNIDLRREQSRKYYRENREICVERKRTYRENNKELVRSNDKKSYHKNKNSYRHHKAAYKKRLKEATPNCLTLEHKQEIVSVYKLAEDCRLTSGLIYHVDHIVPLKGKNICGLHVPWNLQVLPQHINLSKSNKEIPDHG